MLHTINTRRARAMFRCPAMLLCIALGAIAAPAVGQNDVATIGDIRMWHAPQRSRIVFDLDQRAAFDVFHLKKPDRIVVDLQNARVDASIPSPDKVGQFIRAIRAGDHAGRARLVFDLRKSLRYEVQMLTPRKPYRYRLVVDFYPRDAKPRKPSKPRIATSRGKKPKGKLLVVIDPGHGGEDPGASGRHTHEKAVVLVIAKRLQAAINRQRNMRAELTRRGDYYVPLRKRIRIAHSLGADLFVSLHADAFKNSRARGASVYALSLRGASSENAKWLANKENAADLIGAVSLADKEDDVAFSLRDMSMTIASKESHNFGAAVLAELKKIGAVHSPRVERAGFAVLKSPEIPSILVETAYITNPREEKLLRNSKHQTRIAGAIVNGIKRYVAQNPNRYGGR